VDPINLIVSESTRASASSGHAGRSEYFTGDATRCSTVRRA
jgi:hypothetical protein